VFELLLLRKLGRETHQEFVVSFHLVSIANLLFNLVRSHPCLFLARVHEHKALKSVEGASGNHRAILEKGFCIKIIESLGRAKYFD
jgi:hypothetical protein